MLDHQKVVSCSKSNLKEVWVALEGGPSQETTEKEVNEKISSFSRNLKQNFFAKIPYQVEQPLITAMNKTPSGQFLPYWSQQFKWKREGILKTLRMGNNFLSLHSSHSDESRYQSTQSQLQDVLTEITKAIPKNDQFPVKKILFSYINVFDLQSQAGAINLSDYFTVNCGIQIKGKAVPLSGLSSQFHFKAKENENLVIKFQIHPINNKIMRLVVDSLGIYTLPHDMEFDKVDNQILNFKEIVKNAFFDCATDRVKTDLGAIYGN